LGDGADDAAIKLAFDVEQHHLKVANAIAQYNANPDGWVYWKTQESGSPTVLTLRPLTAAPYFGEMVQKAGDLRVYMSAYPGAKSTFCHELGLDPKKVAWLSLSSNFEPARRPIVMVPIGSLSKTNIEDNLPRACRMTKKILDRHADRGVIHTNSYAIADQVYDFLAHTEHCARLIYPREADQREGAMLEHQQTEGAVLISPSVGEGFDFKDDRARWQIIVKCPWPSLGDKQVATKAEMDPTWYKIEAFKSLLQIAGRICRSETDFGETFVLDDDVSRLLRDVAPFVPGWFSDAIVYPDSSS